MVRHAGPVNREVCQLTKPNERIVIDETQLRLLEPSPWERTITPNREHGGLREMD